MRLSWVTAGFRSVVSSRFVEIEGMSRMSNAYYNNNNNSNNNNNNNVTMCNVDL